MTEVSDEVVYLVIGGAAIGRDVSGEILETGDWLPDGKPDWSTAGIYDYRGGGGQDGFRLLAVALDAAEENARMLGYETRRVPVA